MAFSKSLYKGQIPITCQLCEESSEIKWKCLLCDFLLCTKCQKLHKKVKSTDQHTIIDIKDIGAYQQQIKDQQNFSNIPCGAHSGQQCCLYCHTCEEVVCPVCITKTHSKHNMIGLAEGYRLSVKKIKTFNSELELKLSNYVRERSNLSSYKSSENLIYEREKQKILDREKVLKHEVEMHTKEILQELGQRWDLERKSVNDADNKSQNINKDLDFRRDTLTKALVSVNACDIFSALKEEKLARKQNKEPVNNRFKKLPRYVPGKMQIQQAQHGELAEPDDDFSLDQYEVKVLKQYKTRLKLVEWLVCCEDGQMWIAYNKGNIIQKIQLSNGSIQVVMDIQAYSVGMALLPSGYLLVSTADQQLKILSQNTGALIAQSKLSVAPFLTGGVHVTRDDKIIVRARTDEPVFPVNGPRKVIVMDIEGRIEKVYDLENNGKHIFSAPQRIITDNDNNIYVIDRLNENMCGTIVALNKTNGVRWKYSGNKNTVNKETFKPKDFAATKLNNIVTTDHEQNMMYILNTLGQCIHFMNTKDTLGIELPYSVDIDNTGTLYIGCSTSYEDKHADAKIYTVQISGF